MMVDERMKRACQGEPLQGSHNAYSRFDDCALAARRLVALSWLFRRDCFDGRVVKHGLRSGLLFSGVRVRFAVVM